MKPAAPRRPRKPHAAVAHATQLSLFGAPACQSSGLSLWAVARVRAVVWRAARAAAAKKR